MQSCLSVLYALHLYIFQGHSLNAVIRRMGFSSSLKYLSNIHIIVSRHTKDFSQLLKNRYLVTFEMSWSISNICMALTGMTHDQTFSLLVQQLESEHTLRCLTRYLTKVSYLHQQQNHIQAGKLTVQAFIDLVNILSQPESLLQRWKVPKQKHVVPFDKVYNTRSISITLAWRFFRTRMISDLLHMSNNLGHMSSN